MSRTDRLNILVTGELHRKEISEAVFASPEISVRFLPVIELKIQVDEQAFNAAYKAQPDFIIFTSAFGVEAYFRHCGMRGLIPLHPAQKVIAVGERTAFALKETGADQVLFPEEGTAAAILRLLDSQAPEGESFFLPRSAIGREELLTGLAERGKKIYPVTMYTNSIPGSESVSAIVESLKHQKPDWIVFQSPSGVSNFLALMEIEQDKQYFSGIKIAVIGRTTGDFLVSKGISYDFCPEKPSLHEIKSGIAKIEGVR